MGSVAFCQAMVLDCVQQMHSSGAQQLGPCDLGPVSQHCLALPSLTCCC